MASKLQTEEMETHLNLTADNRTEWEVYSDDPMMQKKFDKIAQPYKTVGKGKYYRIPASMITIRGKTRKKMSPEQKESATLRMLHARKNSKETTE